MQTTIKVVNLHKRMLPDPVEIKPATSWSPVGQAYDWDTKLLLPFLNQWHVGNNQRNDFRIKLHKNNVAKLGFELATPGSAVRHATNWAMEPDSISMIREGTIWGICRICIVKSRILITFTRACKTKLLLSVPTYKIYWFFHGNGHILSLILLNNFISHTHFWLSPIRLHQILFLFKFTNWMTNSVDPDQMASGSALFAKGRGCCEQQDKG